MSEGGVITLVLAAVAGIVWAVRIEGKVESHAREHASMRADVQYIRERIDRVLEDR